MVPRNSSGPSTVPAARYSALVSVKSLGTDGSNRCSCVLRRETVATRVPVHCWLAHTATTEGPFLVYAICTIL